MRKVAFTYNGIRYTGVVNRVFVRHGMRFVQVHHYMGDWTISLATSSLEYL